jgi:3-hydroxyisobutyrate dehydrogenase-like beta-hydroxyacid dehydrogenase
MSSLNAKTYETAPSQNVAFLGLGVMGYPMAGHLARAGHAVTVYNRSAAKAAAWCQEFADSKQPAHAATPREAVQNADIIFCCVGNDDDLRAVVLGADITICGRDTASGGSEFFAADNGTIVAAGSTGGVVRATNSGGETAAGGPSPYAADLPCGCPFRNGSYMNVPPV